MVYVSYYQLLLLRVCVYNVILQSDWFAKIPGILHNVVNTILPDPFHEGGVWVVRLDTTA